MSPIDFRSNGCLEVKPQAHLDVPGRVELTAHHPEVLWRRYVCTRFEREILAPAEHGVVEGIDKLHVETRGKPFHSDRVSVLTEYPRNSAKAASLEPINPDAPVISIVLGVCSEDWWFIRM